MPASAAHAGDAAPALLVIDDEQGIRDLLRYELEARGYAVTTARCSEEALEIVGRQDIRLVISDVRMPGRGGLDTLDAIKRLKPDVEVILATGYGTVDTAVSAMKRGAYDFVQKPFNLDELLALVEKALEKGELRALVALHESSRAIFSSVRLEEMLAIVARLASQLLKADDASIMTMSPEGKLVVVAAVGMEKDDARKRARVALGERVAGKVALYKEPVIISGPLQDDPRFSDVESLREVRSSIVFPLSLKGEVLGVLNANRTANAEPFNSSDLRHATIFGSQIAQALHNAKLYSPVGKAGRGGPVDRRHRPRDQQSPDRDTGIRRVSAAGKQPRRRAKGGRGVHRGRGQALPGYRAESSQVQPAREGENGARRISPGP